MIIHAGTQLSLASQQMQSPLVANFPISVLRHRILLSWRANAVSFEFDAVHGYRVACAGILSNLTLKRNESDSN